MNRNKQKGATLIVALILLTVFTMLGVSTMKSSTLSLKMSANDRTAFNNFQAGASALNSALKDGSIVAVLPQAQSVTYSYKVGTNSSGVTLYSKVNVSTPLTAPTVDGFSGEAIMRREITAIAYTPDPTDLTASISSATSVTVQVQGILLPLSGT